MATNHKIIKFSELPSLDNAAGVKLVGYAEVGGTLTNVQIDAGKLLGFKVTVLETPDLSEVTDPDTHTIYFVPVAPTEKNAYDEYVYILKEGETVGTWEKIGSTAINYEDLVQTYTITIPNSGYWDADGGFILNYYPNYKEGSKVLGVFVGAEKEKIECDITILTNGEWRIRFWGDNSTVPESMFPVTVELLKPQTN